MDETITYKTLTSWIMEYVNHDYAVMLDDASPVEQRINREIALQVGLWLVIRLDKVTWEEYKEAIHEFISQGLVIPRSEVTSELRWHISKIEQYLDGRWEFRLAGEALKRYNELRRRLGLPDLKE